MEQLANKECSEFDEELTINLKNIFLTLWNRKFYIAKIFTFTLLFFILLAFILPKKWTVTADLYINKANSTNFLEINPYAIEDAGSMGSLLGAADPLANEIELMQSPLVMDKVIKENDLRFKKLYGIIPTKKTGEYLTTEKFIKKGPGIESKKGTKVLHISYTSKDKDLAYSVVVSIIKNYIALHKQINNIKSKSDKALLEAEYNKAKADLDNQVKTAGGLPTQSLTGTGNLTAMSTFSRSAQNVISNIKGQYIAGEKSRIGITESSARVSQLASKLEWAKLVDEMSDSSKVFVISKPTKLRDWEYSSPKLFTNILLGIVFGVIFSLIGVVYKELTDKKLSYSMLGNDVIYDLDKEFNRLCAELISNSDKKTALVYFDNLLTDDVKEKLKNFVNLVSVKAEISSSFKTLVKNAENIVLLEKINNTSREDYKLIKHILENMNKNIIYEILAD